MKETAEIDQAIVDTSHTTTTEKSILVSDFTSCKNNRLFSASLKVFFISLFFGLTITHNLVMSFQEAFIRGASVVCFVAWQIAISSQQAPYCIAGMESHGASISKRHRQARY